MSEPGNGWAFRLSSLEQRAGSVEDRLRGRDVDVGVLQREMTDVKEDIHTLAEELSSIRKILMGFLVTFAFTGITIVISIVILTGGIHK